jgi:LysM repeat protein
MFEEVPLRDYSGGGRRGPGILLAIAGLLLVGVVAFLAAVLLGGPNRPNQVGAASPTAGRTAAATSPDTNESTPPGETESPTPTAAPSTPTAPTPSPTGSAGPVASGEVYEVRPGDSLCVIARRFGVTAAAILAANPQVKNPDRINAGDELIIPAKGTTPETTPSTSVPPC